MRSCRLLAWGLFFGTLFLGVFALSMGHNLDHDENQFVASGALLARQSLLPYLDYPYFHMPNLVLVDAALFRASDHLLLTARAASAVAGCLTAVLVFVGVRRAFAADPGAHGGAAGAAAALATLVLATNPLFTCTSGRAWNHDLPTFLTAAAFLCVAGGLRRVRPALPVALGGVLLGLAIGTRLTFAPAALSFALMFAICPSRPRRERAGLLLAFSAGAALALLPSWALLARAPAEFVFGNFTYPALNTQFRADTGFPRAMTPAGKLKFVFTDLLARPGNLLLFAGFVASLVGLARGRLGTSPHPGRFEARCLLLLIGGLLVGSFAPTPLFPVYFYEPVPFAILFVAYVVAGRGGRAAPTAGRRPLRWAAAAGLLAIAASIPTYLHVANPFDSGTWIPVRVHAAGRELARVVGPGRVLTYSPIFALEGGLDIYEELATGPFSARAARMISEVDEARFHVADDKVWKHVLRGRPAAAILTGYEGKLDEDLLAGLPARRLRAMQPLRYQTKQLHVYLWLPRGARNDSSGEPDAAGGVVPAAATQPERR